MEQNAVFHSSHRAMVTDVSKLIYTSVIFVDLEVKVDETYYSDLILSQQTVISRILGIRISTADLS